MGHLFSRAFRRITHNASQSRNQEQQHVEQQDKEKQGAAKLVTAESIPVGQSIDSAEYTALQTNHNKKTVTLEPSEDAKDKLNKIDNKQDVEEAVIKIQALVRGHLTRKALKDAHQHSAPNALGQSQFDEESLTRNPPTAFFLPSTPLNLNAIDGDLQKQQTASSQGKITSNDQVSGRSTLESIAEVTETAQPSNALNNFTQLNHQQQKQEEIAADDRKRSSQFNARSASSPSKIEIPSPDSRTASPVPSEANASIDLGGATPASASIDIQDHNLKPIDKIASVLHHKEKQSTEASPTEKLEQEVRLNDEKVAIEGVPVVETSDSLESEEAAAIRIQSAFRGYRTRKNSPYRTRSPQSAAQNKRHALTRQQEASALLENNVDGEQQLLDLDEQQDAAQVAQSEGRRSSRTRHRESSPITQDVPSLSSVDDLATATISTTEGTTTVRDVDEVLNQQHPTLDTIESAVGSIVADAEQSFADTSVGAGLTAALETEKTVNLTPNQMDGNQHEDNHLETPRKTSAKESEASFDTDSSVLGAALSLNSEDTDLHGLQQSIAPSASILCSITEDKSISSMNDELEIEARRLVDEMQMGTEIMNDQSVPHNTTNDECALEEATQQLESVLEDTVTGVESLLLDEEEQRAIELESDDIERRDPRGHGSEDRCKSPQIKTEPPTLKTEAFNKDDDSLVMRDMDENQAGGLSVEQVDDGKSSGRSSPALNSSANASSEEEEYNSDNNQQNNEPKMATSQPGGQQKVQGQQQAGGSKNKKRNNRNKRKGKK